ncbi:MAG TPA: VanW family protein [Pyrinomonadaceae bacterium]|nr:VanW family protein [Pyrinomonadaceae bacterium]
MKKDDIPTRTQVLVFKSKASLLQIKRGIENLFDKNLRRFSINDKLKSKPSLAESITPLWTEKEPEEQFLQAGKIQNLRQAIRHLNGLHIHANEVFSFWKHVGKTTRRKGYEAGRELREGCIIPNIGGGLCQLSNALYDAALRANFEIVERHAHTQVVRGSLAEQNRDATVFWNYVDLRFKSQTDFYLDISMDAENLTVRFRGEKQKIKPLVSISRNKQFKPAEIGSCATCGVSDCHLMVKPSDEILNFGRTAFLVDEFMPEFDEYIQQNRTAKDSLFIPIDGNLFKKANYAWTLKGFNKINQSLLVTAMRSYKSRKLATQGAARQNNLLGMYEVLALTYAKQLKYDALHLVIQQNLLPFLWNNGDLGGRTYDVLMTALPMRKLQERLDYARKLHPESTTLGDFRADEWLVEAETKALHHARKIITPHSEISSLFPEKSILLDWKFPKFENKKSKVKGQKPTILFPASTVGRKGVYALREAIRGLNVKLLLLGSIIESEDFWQDFEVERTNLDEALNKADLVILPAFVEHKPRPLLKAVAQGIPVIASKACGVDKVEGVKSIDFDPIALRNEIINHLKINERVSAKYEVV